MAALRHDVGDQGDDVEFRSGDLLVFGGPNRRVHHGVPKVPPGTSPDGLGLPPGRLS